MKEKGEKKNTDVMYSVAAAIIRLRYIIFIAFAVAGVYCVLSIGRVDVSDDLTRFLPETMETRQGLDVMEEEFTSFATANIMVSNIGYDRAESLADEIGEIEHIVMVSFDSTSAHYKDAAALFTLSFDGPDSDENVIAAMNSVKELLAPYDTYISSEIGVDLIKEIASEMFGIVVLAAIVIVAVLLFTSRSYFEVIILGVVFAFAALLNMGTNFWLGTISSISNSIAVIMQLALAIDYAIIFAHRYQDELAEFDNERDALTEALAKSIVEISASSLTTIAGLVALMLMQFRLGRDMGLVLAKGIVCSLITVFLLMPGLIMLFPKQIKKTQHRSLVPNIRPWGEFLMRHRFLFVIVFVIVVPMAFVFSNKVDYAFSDSSISEITYSERRAAMHKVTDSFDHSTSLVLIVPKGDYESEKAVLQEVEALVEIKDGLGLAGIEIEDGAVLTDSYTPRMFADLLDIDIELSTLLYQAYGAEHEEYQSIFGDSEEYAVPLIEIFQYLFEKLDQGFVTLSPDQLEEIGPLRESLEQAVEQLEGTVHNRMVFTANVPVESDESVQLVEKVRQIAEKYYSSDSILVLGDVTSARDLGNSYTGDSILISILSITFVLVILLFTFKTVVGSLVLVLVIQGSIWINFSFPYVFNSTPTFVVDMLVSAIQMGATIDYAIVLMNRYLAFRETEDKKNAMADAVNHAFPTLITSGLIMTVAALLIAYRCSDVYVSHIGLAVGRGALISVIMVLTALPQLLVLFDGAIKKTMFTLDLKKVIKEDEE